MGGYVNVRLFSFPRYVQVYDRAVHLHIPRKHQHQENTKFQTPASNNAGQTRGRGKLTYAPPPPKK